MKRSHRSPFLRLTSTFRADVLTQWIAGCSTDLASAARHLTEHACHRRLIKREFAVSSALLEEWCRRGKPPLWAALAAFDLRLNNGWRPETSEDWAGFASLFIKLNESNDLESLCQKLPDGMDVRIAAGWLTAAMEEDLHYRTRHRIAEGNL
ncbi:MAG: hypothetical protein FT726_05000 [Pantoea sp. Morm]|uniref:hypothetical protein n=1 Tax=Pantoea sp. Morm TaxID=2601250 RepID=UPI001DA13591|nr:hypothetical protein [Pantoea sp. Morm]